MCYNSRMEKIAKSVMKSAVAVSVLVAAFGAFAQTGGAASAPVRTLERLRHAHAVPPDFNSYWEGEIARQRKEVPLAAATVKRVKWPDRGQWEVWDITVPALGARPVRGVLTIPKGTSAHSLPIAIRYGGAGTRDAPVLAYERAIAFSVNPCGCENGRDKAYYDEYFSTVAKDYQLQGWDDRDKCFFHGQVLRVVRSLEWVKTLPEWNGKDLVVHGFSMGGAQTLQAAALDPDVTVIAANDPALCDITGPLATPKRLEGWPWILSDRKNAPKEEREAVCRNADYFDSCFFATRITCRAFLTSGYMDGCCPSEGVFIAYMNIRGQKQLTVDPAATHCGTVNVPFDEFCTKLCGASKILKK